jgi:hypothetical protein
LYLALEAGKLRATAGPADVAGLGTVRNDVSMIKAQGRKFIAVE